jgi:hypothetical protein
MEINIKTLAICVPVIILASFMVGRYTVPSKVVTKTEIQTVTQIAETAKVNTQQDKDVVVTETDKPDGTKIKQTEYVDRVNTESVDTKTTQTTTDSKSSTVTTNEKYNWNVAALAGVSSDQSLFDKQIGYGAIIQRKIIGPFYVGVWGSGFGTPVKSGGVSIGGSF